MKMHTAGAPVRPITKLSEFAAICRDVWLWIPTLHAFIALLTCPTPRSR
jgi:hypothetical protein